MFLNKERRFKYKGVILALLMIIAISAETANSARAYDFDQYPSGHYSDQYSIQQASYHTDYGQDVNGRGIYTLSLDFH